MKFDIPCYHSVKHKSQNSDKARKTHGVDFFASYECPLSTATQENVTVSAKYWKKYPSNPTRILKDFIKDLAETIDCIKLDANFGGHRVSKRIKRVNHTGVIFWLAHEEPEEGILDKIEDFRNTEDLNYEAIYLVDNLRAQFILTSVMFASQLYPGEKIEFVYPYTGNNIDAALGRISSGGLLPVQYINSSVLPLKVSLGAEEILVLTVIDNFEVQYLRRMISLAQNLTQGFGNKIVICFPDYHELEHSNLVGLALSDFSDRDFLKKIEVKSFKPDFRALE